MQNSGSISQERRELSTLSQVTEFSLNQLASKLYESVFYRWFRRTYIFRSSYTNSSILVVVAYAARLTEDGITKLLEKPIRPTFEESLHSPQCIYWTTTRSPKNTLCWVCVLESYAFLCFDHFAAPIPYTRYLCKLRLSCFAERGVRFEACTVRYASGWHCGRTSSMLNNIGGARTWDVFQVDQ